MTAGRTIGLVLLVVLGAGCGDAAPAEPLRAARAAVPFDQGDGSLVVLSARPDADLSPGEERAFAFAARPPTAYVVRVRFDGGAPELFGASGEGGEFARLDPMAGGSGADLVEATQRPSDAAARVVVRAGTEPLRLTEVTVMRRADVRAPRGPGDDLLPHLRDRRPFPTTVMSQQRRAFLIPPGTRFDLPLSLPANATRVAFAYAPDPRVPLTERRRPPARFSISWADDAPVFEDAVSGPAPAWTEATLAVGDRAGSDVVLRVRCGAGGEALAFSVPEILCERGARRPNLILISLDTTRADHLGAYGYERPTTPRLDRLAEESVLFERALSNAPYTLPSHTTLFSGQYPSGHGVMHPAHAIDVGRTPMLAALLARRGYRTRAFTGGGYLSSDYGFGHGFSAYGNLEPIRAWDNPEVTEVEDTRAGALFAGASAAQSWDAALAFVEDSREVPFFLFLQTFAVHDYTPPRTWRDRFLRGEVVPELDAMRSLADQRDRPFTAAELAYMLDLYDATLGWVDARLGELLDRLEELGLAGHTVVAVTSDHGESFGERAGGLHGHGHSLHAELLRVPLIVHAPGTSPRRVRERVTLVDLAPTLLDLLEIEAPAAMQGRSLRGLLEGRAVEPSPALAEVRSNITESGALHVGTLKVITGNPDAAVTIPTSAPVRLFDVSADEGETTSLHLDDPDTATRLASELARLQTLLGGDGADGPRAAALSPETIAQLKALGYLDG